MIRIPTRSFTVLILLSICLISQQSCNNSSTEPVVENEEQAVLVDPIFTLLSSSYTKVNFKNTLVEDENFHYYNYEYIYNGAGVAVVDINNDGLPDLFFTGNQVSNQLYLNKGNLIFEEITKTAGVAAPNSWCTGVTTLDINNDGFQDIYVCCSFNDDNPQKRANLLFINNGINTFDEKAAEYGIADIGYATQATFLDYDKDGDLDLYVGNHPREFHPTMLQKIQRRAYPDIKESDKLYNNQGNGHFVDVTVEAGILNFGFALSVVANDINHDGYTDIYVTNDYIEDDFLYLNNGDGTFRLATHQAFKHISNFGMGADIADYNNDGLVDILVLDMMAEDNYRQKTNMSAMEPDMFWFLVDNGYHLQYMRNTLQLNNGNGSFSEIGQLAGIPFSDWSWAPLFADFDNDGYKDLIITNGYRRDTRNNDYLIAYKQKMDDADGNLVVKNIDELLDMMPEVRLSNYAYLNNGDLTFTNVSEAWGFDEPSFSYGAAIGDLDGDGDVDVVINNTQDEAFIYRNNANELNDNSYLRIKLVSENNGSILNTKVTLTTEGSTQYQELTLTRGYVSAVENVLHFGLGDKTIVDQISIEWPDGKIEVIKEVEINQTLEIFSRNATKSIGNSVEIKDLLFTDFTGSSGVDFIHKENEYNDYDKEILLPHKMSQFGPNVAVGDVNNDGLPDFFIGGASWQTGSLYLQNPDQSFTRTADQAWFNDKVHEDIGVLFFDCDNDGDLDLYVVSGGNEFSSKSQMLQDRLYLNDGVGNFSKSRGRLPKMLSSGGGCVISGDYDDDGDLDLFIGGRVVPSKYPFPPRSYILNNNNGVFSDVTKSIAPDLANIGMVTSAVWTDYNEDNTLDLIVVGEWMPVTFFENIRSQGGTYFENRTEDLGFLNTVGWWNKIVAADYDNDGDEDYMVGNLGWNYKYKVSTKEPLHVYCYDFDKSGNVDIVLGYYNGGTCFPVRGRECSSNQMPFIKQKFENYDSYGKASIVEVYGDDLDEALHYEATLFSSCFIKNEGNHRLSITALPVEAQFSTIYGMIPEDFDGDGNMDVLVAGNFYVSEVETGRADAGIGLFLKGDGQGSFKSVISIESGFFAPNDVRSLALVGTANNNESLIIIANNNSKVSVFKWNKKLPTVNESLAQR